MGSSIFPASGDGAAFVCKQSVAGQLALPTAAGAAVSLAAKADTSLRRLPGGRKGRVVVPQALGHRRPVVVLDAPTAGVEVELRQGLWQFSRRMNCHKP